MDPEEVFAVLRSMIDQLEEETIKEAVLSYMSDHPEVVEEILASSSQKFLTE